MVIEKLISLVVLFFASQFMTYRYLTAEPIRFKFPIRGLSAKSGFHVKWEPAKGASRLEFGDKQTAKETEVKLDQQSGMLYLSRKDASKSGVEKLSFHHSKQKVILYADALKSIELDGDASFDGKKMRGKKIRLHILSRSSISLDGSFDSVLVSANDASDVVLSGKCKETFKAELSGTSTLNAAKLRANAVEAQLTGATVGYFWSEKRISISTEEVSEAIVSGKGKLRKAGKHKANIVRL